MSGASSEAGRGRERLDVLFAVLADARRRAVLRYFLDADATVASVDQIAAAVVERDPRADDPDDVALELHHASLPKLRDASLIEYEGREVRYRGDPLVEACLGLADDGRA